MLKKIGIIVSLMGINCVGMQNHNVIKFHLNESTPIHFLLPNSLLSNYTESYWVDFPDNLTLEVTKNCETNRIEGCLYKDDKQKSIAYPEPIYEFLKNESIYRTCKIDQKNYLGNSKLVAFLTIKTTKDKSSIVRKHTGKDCDPNVHVYEACYKEDKVTITGNKKDIKNPKVKCSNGELNRIEKGQLQVNITNASIYRCFISKDGERVQELSPLASRLVYNFLQEKHEEMEISKFCGISFKQRVIDNEQLSRERTITIS